MPKQRRSFYASYKKEKARAEIAEMKLARLGWVPIPEYGDLMSIEDFIQCCVDGEFIDYDGHGKYSDGSFMLYHKQVYPSQAGASKKTIDMSYTHIIWFNK